MDFDKHVDLLRNANAKQPLEKQRNNATISRAPDSAK